MNNQPAPVLDIRALKRAFTQGDVTIHVLRGIDLAIQPGEIVALLGPSGSGKSTILRLIAGLRPQHPATSGSVLVSGRPVIGPGADRGMVFQDYTSFDNRTVEDNVAFGLECRGMPAKERRE